MQWEPEKALKQEYIKVLQTARRISPCSVSHASIQFNLALVHISKMLLDWIYIVKIDVAFLG